MSILVIFFTGKQNGGYHRKLPASLKEVRKTIFHVFGLK